MTVTAKVYVTGRTLGQLADAVSTAIGNGMTPDGPAFLHEGMLVQGMQTGTVPSTFDGLQTDVTTNTTNIATNTSDIAPLKLAAGQHANAADAALPATAGTELLSKAASAGAYTLAAPATAGLRKRLISTTAKAHVITATGLIDDGTTGGAKTTITCAAFVGASIELESTPALHWAVIATNNVVIT